MKENNSKLFAYIILFTAGMLSVCAYAPINRPMFIVISLFALLWQLDKWYQVKAYKKVMLGSFMYAFGFFLSQIYWFFYSLYNIIGASFIVAILALIGAICYLAIYILLAIYLFKTLYTRSLEFNYLFLFPSCWVLGEWLRSWLIAGFSWSDIAYTQINNYFLKGFFPVVGSYGISWLSMSVIGFLYIVLRNNRILTASKPQINNSQRLSIVYFILIVLSGYFLHNKQYTQPYGKPISVALVQGNISQAQKWGSNNIITTLGIYEGLVAKAKADIIILPETAFTIYEKYLPEHYMSDLVKFAHQNKAELLIGMPKIINNTGDYVNSVALVTNPKKPFYAKHHLVPYGEYIPFPTVLDKIYSLAKLPLVGFTAGGESQEPLVIANQKVAINICYENGFGSELLRSSRNSTLMVNLSDMVWYGPTIAKDEHLQLSQARALENQRYFIQETNTGLTAVIGPNGEIQSRLPSFQQGILQDYVVGRIGETPYQRYANYPIIILCFLILAVAAIFLRKQ